MKLEDYSKYYIQGSDHYLVPKNTFVELFNEMINWKEETTQLKNNWEELKRWLYEEHHLYIDLIRENSTYTEVFKKMLELEKGGSNE